jgi:hypothetical protein
MASVKYCQKKGYMDVVRLINKVLSDEDIHKILGVMPKSLSMRSWGTFTTTTNCCQMKKITALYFTRTDQTEGTGQPS